MLFVLVENGMYNTITKFRGKYGFLSNFYHVPHGIDVSIGGFVVNVPTVEHAYQASKFSDEKLATTIAHSKTPAIAKDTASRNKSAIIKDWKNIRVFVMQNFLKQKFKDGSDLLKLLINTGDAFIVEGNDHGDNFWGSSPVGNPKGQNMLGILLMNIRDQHIKNCEL